MTRSCLLLLAAATLAACATPGRPRDDSIEQMTRECAARGGILLPIPGAHHGNERANWSCEIRGGASRTR